MNPPKNFPAMTVLLCLAACGGENADNGVPAKRNERRRPWKQAPRFCRTKPPVDALNVYLDGFHFYNGNMQQPDGGASLLRHPQ